MKHQFNPQVLAWARQRAGLTQDKLGKRMSVPVATVSTWEADEQLTFAKLNKLAAATNTGLGFLFLKTPPVEKLPVADFRRVAGEARPPSAELLDTIYAVQERQQWYREYALLHEARPLSFVGCATTDTPCAKTAQSICMAIGIGPHLTTPAPTVDVALRNAIEAIEHVGILVMRCSQVSDSNNRQLRVEEFRGFALVDDIAPVVFVNSRDAPAAQMFTLAHEVAHIWIGQSGVSGLDKTYANGQAVEQYCNEVAAEVLVPKDELLKRWTGGKPYDNEIKGFVSFFKVSSLVIARRACDAGLITKAEYDAFYDREASAFRKGGGNEDTYLIKRKNETGARFARAVIQDARDGRTLYSDAMQLLGIKKDKTYRQFAEHLNLKA